MMMKRSRQEDDSEDTTTAIANYLMLLSAAAAAAAGGGGEEHYGRVFTCKTCNRQFSSFQALGGHRASHKKPRLLMADGGRQPPSPPKMKTHECSVCGLEFPIGQALGGHMRRHRAAAGAGAGAAACEDRKQAETAPPVVKTAANNGRRVLCVDLNLTPLENKYVFGKISPVV